jgi:hypothetical protein
MLTLPWRLISVRLMNNVVASCEHLSEQGELAIHVVRSNPYFGQDGADVSDVIDRKIPEVGIY